MDNLKIGGNRLARVKKVGAALIAWFSMLHCVCCFVQMMAIAAVSSGRNSLRLEYADSSDDESAREGEEMSRPRKSKRSHSSDGVFEVIRESALLAKLCEADSHRVGCDDNLVNMVLSTDNDEDSGEDKSVTEDEDLTDICNTSMESSQASSDGLDEVTSKLRKRKRSQRSARLVQVIRESFMTLNSCSKRIHLETLSYIPRMLLYL